MAQINAKLIVDFGNSETRGTVIYGKNEATGRLNKRSFVVSNRFKEIPKGYTPSPDYSDLTSTIFNVNCRVGDNAFVGAFVNGELQAQEFSIAPLRPSATEKKYNSSVTALSMHIAILEGYRQLQKLTGASNLADIDVIWDVLALLPPEDVATGSESLAHLIKSIVEVDCLMPSIRLPFKVNRVAINPEGFCSYVAVVFDDGLEVKPEMASLLEETILVFDIGAGTSDMVIINQGKLLESTMHTIERGGNNVAQLVKRLIRREYNGLTLTDASCTECIINCAVKDGSRVIDITDIVNRAKSEIAKHLVTDMQSYLEETEFNIRSVNKLLICGGGAIEEGKSKALVEATVEYLKNLSPHIELIDMPTHTVESYADNGILTRSIAKMSPRDLNIIGASILAEMM